MQHRWASILAAATLTSAHAQAARADEVGFPCDGCVVIGKADGTPRPLVVVLHGDEGGPSRLVGAWKIAASKADVTLFAPKCPASEKCAGSFWQWNGDPTWLFDQMTQVASKYAVDPKRRYLAGWSGGSTYLTFRISEWFPTFAAVSIAGGGAPSGSACFARAGGACAPVHYLMGNANPLFSLATGARDRIRACGHELTWEELPGADHEREWQIYTTKTPDILAWLLAHEDGCEPPAPPSPAAPSSSTAPPISAPSTPQPGAAPGPRELPPMQTSRCTCDLASPSTDALGPCLAAVIALALAKRRAYRFER